MKENTKWELKTLSIEYMTWGEYRGKYAGKISFANGENDAFTFSLSAEECAEYLSLIQKKVGTHASVLGSQIAESLKLLESKTIQIPVTNP